MPQTTRRQRLEAFSTSSPWRLLHGTELANVMGMLPKLLAIVAIVAFSVGIMTLAWFTSSEAECDSRKRLIRCEPVKAR